jgi:hypothetical protein
MPSFINIGVVDSLENIHNLELNNPFPVLYAARCMRESDTMFLVAILQKENHVVRIYMPEINDKELQDNLILAINTRSEKYNLNYKGLSEGAHGFHLVHVHDT